MIECPSENGVVEMLLCHTGWSLIVIYNSIKQLLFGIGSSKEIEYRHRMYERPVTVFDNTLTVLDSIIHFFEAPLDVNFNIDTIWVVLRHFLVNEEDPIPVLGER